MIIWKTTTQACAMIMRIKFGKIKINESLLEQKLWYDKINHLRSIKLACRMGTHE